MTIEITVTDASGKMIMMIELTMTGASKKVMMVALTMTMFLRR